MDSITAFDRLEVPSSEGTIDPQSLYVHLAQLTDGRQARGRRYSAALVLTLLLLAKLAGETTLSGAAHWIRLRRAWICQVLPVRHPRLPCGGTYRYVLAHLSAEQLLTQVRQFFETLPAAPSHPSPDMLRQVALDGKTLRGTLGPTRSPEAAVHLLAAYDVERGLVLAQQAVTTKENEISVLPSLLRRLALQGCLLTADALHTQRAFCRQVTKAGGHYVLIAKANHPEIRDELALYFSDPQTPPSELRSAHTWDKGHGRRERRVLQASTALNEYLTPDWPGVQQVFRLERTIWQAGHRRQEAVYGLTSCPAQVAHPLRLLAWVRAHWRSENRLHWRRDVTLGEDHCQLHGGPAPIGAAVLNSTVLTLLDRLRIPNVAAAQRRYAAAPWLALRLLVGPPDF